jgi:hypothetical protein
MLRDVTIGDRIAAGETARYVVKFFGWCYDAHANHDKIWGWVIIGRGSDASIYNFWGRRNRSLSFKRHDTTWGSSYLRDLTDLKMRRRPNGQYEEIEISRIEEVFPNFYEQFEKQLVLAKLFDKVRGEGDYGKNRQ